MTRQLLSSTLACLALLTACGEQLLPTDPGGDPAALLNPASVPDLCIASAWRTRDGLEQGWRIALAR